MNSAFCVAAGFPAIRQSISTNCARVTGASGWKLPSEKPVTSPSFAARSTDANAQWLEGTSRNVPAVCCGSSSVGFCSGALDPGADDSVLFSVTSAGSAYVNGISVPLPSAIVVCEIDSFASPLALTLNVNTASVPSSVTVVVLAAARIAALPSRVPCGLLTVIMPSTSTPFLTSVHSSTVSS